MTGDNTYHLPVSLSDAVGGGEPESYPNVKRKTKLIVGIVGIVVVKLIISVILIIRFAHPEGPKFFLQDATVFNFNLAAAPPHFLNSSLQITVASQNPSQIFAIYYTDLGIYAEYRNQQITTYTTIPPLYQAHKETTVWSLFINGVNVPIAPNNVPVLTTDQSTGIINIIIKLEGHVRWKIWSINTRKYHIHVFCNAMMDFGANSVTYDNGTYAFLSVKYLLYRGCTPNID